MNKINKTVAMAILFCNRVRPLGAECCSTCHGVGLAVEALVDACAEGVFGCLRCEEGTTRLDLLLDGLGFETHREADLAVDQFILQNEDEIIERLNEMHAA